VKQLVNKAARRAASLAAMLGPQPLVDESADEPRWNRSPGIRPTADPRRLKRMQRNPGIVMTIMSPFEVAAVLRHDFYAFIQSCFMSSTAICHFWTTGTSS
jgi:hypothetical protein